MPDNGWEASAQAWIRAQGDAGDWSRRHVLDAPMLQRARALNPHETVDIGCGEGRFCRLLRQAGLAAIGVEPAPSLLAHARARDPQGRYLAGRAEALPLDSDSCDLAVAYLSLIDIPDLTAAVAEAWRVLRPGGHVLIANLQGFASAGGWRPLADGTPGFVVDRYLESRAAWQEWDGIRVHNWHRPLSAYMAALLEAGFVLSHFAEPEPDGGGDPQVADRYRRAPWLILMEWRKPRSAG